MSNIPCILNAAYQALACTIGQLFNVYRPPYGSVLNQGPSFIGTVPLSVVPGGEKFAIPKVAGVNYVTVAGDFSAYLPGDDLQAVNPNSSIPTITILNNDGVLPCIAFRTSRQCGITLDIDNFVYQNAYFDYMSITTATAGLIDDLSGALDISHKKVVTYSKTLILPQYNTYDIAGMRLVETDGTNPVRYTIQSVSTLGNLVIFSIDQEVT